MVSLSEENKNYDVLTVTQRKYCMSRIKCKNTKPEMLVRKALHRQGFRYQLHRNDLPGKPDMVFPKYRTVIFINGCFWHRHGCKLTYLPKANRLFWEKKFSDTILRDTKNIEALKSTGWSVIIVWECELQQDFKNCISELISHIKGNIF